MIEFFAAGLPVPQGSMRAFVVGGRARVTSTSGHRLQDWRQAIAQEARRATESLLSGPVVVELVFALPRPRSRAKRELWPDRKPDSDKLARAALDSMSGVLFKDDAQVVGLLAWKRYAASEEQIGVYVSVREAADFDRVGVASRRVRTGVETKSDEESAAR